MASEHVFISSRELETLLSICLEKLDLNIQKLSEYQFDALYSLLCRKDTFVNLPTGHGKSLVYQLSVLVSQLAAEKNSVYPSSPVVIVVSPLNSLIADQISSCNRLGLTACKLDSTTISQAQEYGVCFTSPETLESQACFNFIQELGDRLLAIVVDESHCTVSWGLSHKDAKPFREAYSRVGNVRSLTRAPVICLTATASTSMRKKIIKILNMNDTKVIRHSPDKDNIKISINKAPKEMEDIFASVMNDLKQKGRCMDKTIIYCRSLKDCGDIYSLFNENLVTREHYAMFHSKTPARIQESVLSSLLEPEGDIRVCIATCALGLGVNIPNVRLIIHFGFPTSIEDYIQEIGRGGRDGLQSHAVGYYKGYHLAHCEPSMKQFIKNAEKKCRRKTICEYFNKSTASTVCPENCCDVCSELPTSVPLSSKANSTACTFTRTVDDNDKKLLKEILHEIPERPKTASIFGTNNLKNLTDDLINDLCESASYVFSIEYLMDNHAIFDSWLAHEILTVFNEVFEDITESELEKARNLEDYWLDDSDEDIPEWCLLPNNDSDSEVSE